ncbi:MAG: ADP-ribose pyrophosphatase [Candidatus Saccharibacteria bacterium]|nr:ADP-ribose pyrophosphatase [Candidatus Saccharibacteria bacterium]
MKPFLTLDESSIDPTLEAPSREGYSLRQAARAVVSDEAGAIALLHVTRDSYYKLPGGGIDAGEDPLQALERELLEEIGCRATITHDLGTVLEQRYYQEMTQISHCYIANLIGEKGQPDYTDEEREAGFEIVWAKDIHAAVVLLESSVETAADDIDITFMRMRDVAITKRALTFLTQ